MKKRILACLLALVMLIGVMPVAMATEAETDGTDGYEWIVSKSKEATALDANKESTITLSLPSAEETLASDVVFVLDTSSCVGEVMNQVSGLIAQLKSAQEKNKADIKVGAVIFNGSSYTMFGGKLVDVATAIESLNDLSTKATSEKKVWEYFGLDKDPNYVNKGSNLHAGLRAAQKLLDSDDAVSAGRKYLVSITDGMTYYWNDEQDNVYGIYSGSNANGATFPSLLFYAWCEAHNISMSKSYQLPKDFKGWDSYLANAKKLEAQDNGEYAINIRETKNTLAAADFGSVRFSTVKTLNDKKIPYIPETDKAKHAHGMDYSVTACLNTYQEMVDVGYQCYTLNPDYRIDTFPGLFTSKLNEMAKKTVIDFDSIQNDILYAVGTGSTVVDKMGSEFKFGGLETVTLKVGTETLTNSTISGNTITFAHDGNATAHVITYDPDEDAFTWTINENVSNFAPVQLSYKVQLDKPSTEPGDHKVPTNEYAKLNPQDSSGVEGTEQEFPKPEVTYTVDEQGNVVPGVEIFLPAFALAYDDHYSYLIGYSDGTVRPNGKITRAEVATIFFRLLDDDTRAKYWSSENNFSDVSADKWYNNAVSTLSNMGVIGGYADGTFRPDAPISRAEFAKIAVSFTQNTGSATYNYFTDVKTTDWFAPYVTAAKDAGLIEGYSDGSFKPESKITRAEACAIVNRTLGRKPSKAHMKISDRIDWPDVQTTDWFYEAIMEATNSHTYQMGKRVETWNDKLPQRDWAALETGWANAYTGNGGEVR
ncbi:MAG: S-layer homology domain-containing protein [Clostridiales bacterium]|nr:S-layer homology domain-containing protein [Clostridiales bacterium]